MKWRAHKKPAFKAGILKLGRIGADLKAWQTRFKPSNKLEAISNDCVGVNIFCLFSEQNMTYANICYYNPLHRREHENDVC